MKRIAVLTAVLMLASCAALDRGAVTEFRPANTERTSWNYLAHADIVYPPDSPDAEQIRMEWLATWMDINRACQYGYNVISRETVQRMRLKAAQDIYYTVECR